MSSLVDIPSETSRIIICIVLCTGCYVTSLALAYCLYIFNKIKVLLIYKKRYPRVVKFECYMCLVMCSIIWPIWIVHASDFPTFTTGTHGNSMNVIVLLNYIIYPFFGHGVACLEFCRLWIMYYKINNLNAVSNNQWQSVIGSSSNTHHWYLMHSTTFGRLRWIMKRVFCWYLFGAFTSMLLITNFGFTPYTQIVDCFFYGVPMLSILYWYITLLRKKTLIHDNFLFYLEFNTTNRIFCVGLFFYSCTPIVYILNPYYSHLWTALLGCVVASGPTVISAFYIPKMILKNTLWTDTQHSNSDLKKLHEAISVPASVDSQTNTTILHGGNVYTAAHNMAQLDKIFMNPVYTNEFIHHMIKEFSLESVLSWIEMKQFEYLLYTQLHALNVDLGTYPSVCALAQHIPQSTIVFGDQKETKNDTKAKVMQHFKNKFVLLYEKYINDNSEYCVNISYQLRSQYDCFMSVHGSDAWNINEQELLSVWHEVNMEMQVFMNAALLRFLKSVEWEQVNV
eukprot:215178_1